MDWSGILSSGESIVWEGRPAPRCFTFRNWQHSIFGIIVLIASACWLVFGWHLGGRSGQLAYIWIPLPFLAAGVYLAFGHLLLARFEWEKVFYAMTEDRLIARRGLFRGRVEALALDEVIWFQLRPVGKELGTVQVRCRDPKKKLTVSCIEYPRRLTDRLEEVLERNGIDVTPRHE